MIDRTTKFLLSVIVLLLLVIAVRPLFAPTAARAQGLGSLPEPPPGQMCADEHGRVYVYHAGKLTVLEMDEGSVHGPIREIGSTSGL